MSEKDVSPYIEISFVDGDDDTPAIQAAIDAAFEFQKGDRVIALDYGDRSPGLHGSVVEKNGETGFWFVSWDGYAEPWGHHGKWLAPEIEASVPCPECGGSGQWQTPKMECPLCKGRGSFPAGTKFKGPLPSTPQFEVKKKDAASPED